MYVPNNMVFVAVGDFDAEVAYEKIHEAFKDFERKPIDIPVLRPEPEQLGMTVIREQRDLDVAYLLMGFHTVRLSHPDLYPLDVLSHVLSEGQSSRLYRKLVDELGLVYSVTTWSHTPGYDAGVFAISMTLDPANIDAAVEVVKEEIYRLKDEKVSRDEIDKAKKLKATDFYFARQDIESIASSLGTSEISSGNPDFDALYVENIQKVTAEQIRDVVGKYFYDDNIGIAILEPISEGETRAARVEAKPEAGPVEKHVLDNGLTVLVKQNRTNPIVTLGSYSLAGVRFEDPASNGVANFVATMMPRGTKKRSAEKIAQAIDTMGATYSCTANHTRIQSQMTVLREDLKEGLQLFADILMNPRFDEGEMEKQRALIEASILARADDWNADAMDRMLDALYSEHPYGNPPTGTLETLSGIGRDDLVRHHDSFITPASTVVTVFGDVTSEEAVGLAEKAFGKWKGPDRAAPRSYDEPHLSAPEVTTSYHERAQTVIFMGYRGMPYAAEDRYPMAVLDAVTSGIYYPGGWLHTDLRGNQLVYVVHAYNWTGLDEGYFGLYAATYDEALDQAMEIITGHMERIAREPVSDEELTEAKQLCVIMNETQKQTNSALAHDAAIPELYGLGYDYESDYSAKIKAVTKEDVLRVAKKYLTNPVTIIRRPNPDDHAAID